MADAPERIWIRMDDVLGMDNRIYLQPVERDIAPVVEHEYVRADLCCTPQPDDAVRERVALVLHQAIRSDRNHEYSFATNAEWVARILAAIGQPQPQAPEPDWSTAPKYTVAHAYSGDGCGVWLRENEFRPDNDEYGWEYNDFPFDLAGSGLRLPLGIDPRTTLRLRPEEADDGE